MSSMLDHEALVSTTRVDSDAVILEFVHQLRSEGHPKVTFLNIRAPSATS